MIAFQMKSEMNLRGKKSKQLKAKKPLSSRARDTRQSLAQIGFLGREITELAHATKNGGKLSGLEYYGANGDNVGLADQACLTICMRVLDRRGFPWDGRPG